MPKRDVAPIGAPCWIEIFTSDKDRVVSFYGDLFGWTAEDGGEEYGGYVTFQKDGVPVAGCMGNDTGGPDVWTTYLAVEDAKASTVAVEAHGGSVVVPAMEVMDLGSMAVIADPGGAAVGLWQPGTHQGFGILGETGAPTWFELHTRAYDDSVAFYRDVFGWTTSVASDVPEFRYTTLDEGDDQLAGIMDASNIPDDVMPTMWRIYFGVDDADAALARVVELGGSIVQEAQDTPYGRLAEVADPTGLQFKVMQP